MSLAPARTVQPWRDAIAAAAVVLVVSTTGLGATYYFSRQVQIESVQRELLQLSRLAASTIDVPAHTKLDDPALHGGPLYRHVVAPLVALQRAAPEIFYVYTLIPAGPSAYRHGVDTATVFRRPQDTAPVLALLETYEEADPDLDRTVATRQPQVTAEAWTEPGRRFLSAYAPFFHPDGTVAGVVEVDMWVQTLDARLLGLFEIFRVAAAGLIVLSIAAGAVVLRQRRVAAAYEGRDRLAVVELGVALDAAEGASRAKSEFLATMSHELRTPLNAIVGYSELLAEELADLGDRQMQHDIDRVASASRHLTAIIGDILDYAKLDAGDLCAAPQSIDLSTMLADLADLLRQGATARGLTLVVDVAPGVAAMADPVRLRQVLLNLMGNAVKFTDRGGVRVRVRSAPGRAGVVVVVHDTGVGILRDQQTRLFQPFSQVEASPARSASGTGLGLTISRRLAEAMGGTLRFRSRAGHGSSFRLTLPSPGAATPAA